jgi:hypothetical protein
MLNQDLMDAAHRLLASRPGVEWNTVSTISGHLPPNRSKRFLEVRWTEWSAGHCRCYSTTYTHTDGEPVTGSSIVDTVDRDFESLLRRAVSEVETALLHTGRVSSPQAEQDLQTATAAFVWVMLSLLRAPVTVPDGEMQ